MSPLPSQIVRLTKSILLRTANPSTQPSAQFKAGEKSPFRFSGGLYVTWWYSDDTFKALDAVTALATESSNDFRDCDPDSISEAVMQTLQEICIDRTIFDSDAVCFHQHQTLFECRTAPIPEFATAIVKALDVKLRALIGKQCTIYAVPKFQGESFRIVEDSIHIIAKRDHSAWQALIDKGYQFNGWTPTQPYMRSQQRDLAFAPPATFDYLLVAEEHGTPKGSKFNSILRFRKLTAVLFAIASGQATYPYHKSMARPLEFCIQFPHSSNTEANITRSDCDALVPFYTSDIPIGAAEIAVTKDWYAALARTNSSDKSRIEKGAHFLNRGMMADDIEAYINYFVALDALFGERGSVEASIIEGVRKLQIDPRHLEKTPWLFELRNEIVHGGSRYITEWSKYARYTQHFQTKPLADVQTLAQLAVLLTPKLFAH
jgi:hypothetical protein